VITSPSGDKILPWGSKFAPRGEVKNGPLYPRGGAHRNLKFLRVAI
jgi:hypothetical protein